mmetsp:Transcript_1008/g.3851  ORF Transcript_1008/g.3851 Transcript_1008/m.3851 type:complete len:270 (+) Transcript_1008:1187-1996(+)
MGTAAGGATAATTGTDSKPGFDLFVPPASLAAATAIAAAATRVAFILSVAICTTTPVLSSSASLSVFAAVSSAFATSFASDAASCRRRTVSSSASRLLESADSAAWSFRLACSGSGAFSTNPSANKSEVKSVAHVFSAATNTHIAFVTASSAFARAACAPVSAAGITLKRSSFLRATMGAGAGAASAATAASAASSPASAPASSHPPRLLLPKIRLSCHTLTSFAHDSLVFVSLTPRITCFIPHSIFGQSASIHSGPFLRLFCNTSFAR